MSPATVPAPASAGPNGARPPSWQARWEPLLAFHPRYLTLFATRSADYGAAFLDARLAAHLAEPAPVSTPVDSLPRGLLPPVDASAFITTARLVADTLAMIPALPPDVDAVVGIARSGLIPASVLAAHLHLPLLAVSRGAGVTDPGHGGRMEGRADGPPRHVLLIDDTVAHGREMAACGPIVRERFPAATVTTAAVYATPEGAGRVDVLGAVYPGLHFLEYNFTNAGHGSSCLYDFDGILCEDCPVEDDDDGPRYRDFLRNARPLYLPRRAAAHTIVTARHRKYEAETRAWLARWGVRVVNLVMRDFEYDPGRRVEQIAEFKAGHYARSGLHLFVESEPAQAEIIARLAGRPVLCPSLERVVMPPVTVAPPAPRFDPAGHRAAMAKVNACPDRGCRTGCQKTDCRKLGRDVYLGECIKCVGSAPV